MNRDDLTNSRVAITADSAELSNGQGTRLELSGCVLKPIYVHHYPPPVQVVGEGEGDGRLALLVEFDRPFSWKDQSWQMCVVTNRYVGESIAEATDRPVISALSLLHSPSDDPSSWQYAFAYATVSVEPCRTSAST